MIEAAIVCSLATLVTLQRWYVVRHGKSTRDAGFWSGHRIRGSLRLSDDRRPQTLQRRVLEWVGYWLAVAVVIYVVVFLAYR